MKRTVRVARTAYDLKHTNRLQAPEFGVVMLSVKVGDKSSKSYLQEGAPYKSDGSGSDDFHFVPEKETGSIDFEIDDPFQIVANARLELFKRFKDAPLWSLDLTKLGDDSYIHGKHSLKWDGRVIAAPAAAQEGTEGDDGVSHDLTAFDPDTSNDEFPDGYANLGHAPYKLKLTVASDDKDDVRVAWTYFHILVKSLKIELGPEEAIPTSTLSGGRIAREKMVRKEIETAGVPADGSTIKVHLLSNLYKTADGEMDDNTAFTVYDSLWGSGPHIPLIARIRLKASDDSEVKLEDGPGAKALGKAKFLWDWVDADEDVDGGQSRAKPKTFIKAAIDYYKDGTDTRSAAKDHTYPKGDNCHVDRGGKRGPDGKPVFPAGAGYAKQKDKLDEGICPFKVELCANRKWASFSYAWSKGAMIGRTGVDFRPSRMAGDTFQVFVYFSYDSKLDKGKETSVVDAIDEPLKTPADIMDKTGVFQMWRELHIVRYYRKKATITDFVAANIGPIHDYYNEAYVLMKNVMAGGDKKIIPTAGYDALAKAALNASGNGYFTQKLAVDDAADHSTTDSQFLVRDWAAFKTAVRNWYIARRPTPAAGVTAANNWLTSEGLTNQYDYANKLDDLLFGPGMKVTSDLKPVDDAHDGVTIVHYNYLCSLEAAIAVAKGKSEPDELAITNGVAQDVVGMTRNKCCFTLWNSRVDTFVHEIGHHLFLPHAPFPSGSPPGGNQPRRHDAADSGCVMSYNRPRPNFCGLCQLRLRGWDAGPNSGSAKLNKNGASNKKP